MAAFLCFQKVVGESLSGPGSQLHSFQTLFEHFFFQTGSGTWPVLDWKLVRVRGPSLGSDLCWTGASLRPQVNKSLF